MRIGAANARVEAHAVATTSDGSLIVAGHYSGAPYIELPGRLKLALPAVPLGKLTDQACLFVAYLGPDGTPRRVITSNDLGAWRGVTAIATLGDDLVVLGSFVGRLSFGTGSHQVALSASGGRDIFVLRLDPDGQPRWGRRLGGVGEDSSNSLAVTRQGAVLVAGSFSKPRVGSGAVPPPFGMTFGDSRRA